MSDALLEVDHLTVTFHRDQRPFAVVREVSFELHAGDRCALVGESGCGKSMTCLALTRLPPTHRAKLSGDVRFEGVSVLTGAGADAAVGKLRGRRIAYVFQDPAASLNPVISIGAQLRECIDAPRRERTARAVKLLRRVRIDDPEGCARAYPCELSGGMLQRAMLAMALAADPDLLVADEPTTALDVTTQAEMLALIDVLVEETGLALLLVTHNLGLVAGRCQTIHVMYAGEIVETGPVEDVLRRPAHPYTHGLLQAVPSLAAAGANKLRDIPGTVPPPDALPAGCAFAPRCARADACCREHPVLEMPVADGTARACRCWHPLISGTPQAREGGA